MIIEKNNFGNNTTIIPLGCGCSGSGSGGCTKEGTFDEDLNSSVFSAKQLGRSDASCVS